MCLDPLVSASAEFSLVPMRPIALVYVSKPSHALLSQADLSRHKDENTDLKTQLHKLVQELQSQHEVTSGDAILLSERAL